LKGVTLNNNKKVTDLKDRKAILSTLWVFVMFNYLYADFVTLIFNPTAYQVIGMKMTEELVLGVSALFEISIAMVLLSRVLNYRANRWANIIAGVVFTAFVALILLGGKPSGLYYVFFSTIEIATTLFIIWYAWTWPNDESQPKKYRA
jgi:hypothetical protein